MEKKKDISWDSYMITAPISLIDKAINKREIGAEDIGVAIISATPILPLITLVAPAVIEALKPKEKP